MVWAELVGLRVAAAVDPGEIGFPVGVEVDMLVGIVIGVWIEINVVVVEPPWNVVFAADGLDAEKVVHRAEGFVWRPYVRKTVVVAPTLPAVDGQHGIDEPVADGVRHVVADGCGVSAPDVEDEAACEIAESSGGMLVRVLPVFEGGFEGGGGDGEGERAVFLHAEGGVVFGEIDVKPRRRRVDGRQNTVSVREIQTEMGGRDIVAAEAHDERLWITDDVAMTVNDLFDGIMPWPKGKMRDGGVFRLKADLEDAVSERAADHVQNGFFFSGFEMVASDGCSRGLVGEHRLASELEGGSGGA